MVPFVLFGLGWTGTRSIFLERGEMVDKLTVDPARAREQHDRHRCWLDENASAFAAQARWHEQHPHPLADLLADPGDASSKGQ